MACGSNMQTAGPSSSSRGFPSAGRSDPGASTHAHTACKPWPRSRRRRSSSPAAPPRPPCRPRLQAGRLSQATVSPTSSLPPHHGPHDPPTRARSGQAWRTRAAHRATATARATSATRPARAQRPASTRRWRSARPRRTASHSRSGLAIAAGASSNDRALSPPVLTCGRCCSTATSSTRSPTGPPCRTVTGTRSKQQPSARRTFFRSLTQVGAAAR